MRRIRWSVAAAAVAGLAATWGLGTVSTAEAGEAAAGGADGLARFYRQHIVWHGCQQGPQDTDGRELDEAGAQCAEVAVPLDYRRPRQRAIVVAVSRLTATDTAGRVGPMVINTGGPGNPVLATIPLARRAMGDAGARFDLIGMDQRFSGRSTPLDCGWPANWLSRSAGADRGSFNRSVALSRDLARRCADRHGDLLPHATTANAARDMDVIRAALREAKLSYLGYSYGSYLGALYTQLFPHRAGRIVLDSAIDPAQPGSFKGRGGGPVREAALRDWAAWAAERDDQYHLGATAARVMSTVDRVYEAAARRPLRVGPYRVDDTVVPALLLEPLIDETDDDNAALATTVQVLVKAVDDGTAQPTPALADALARRLTGAGSATASPQTAIMCADDRAIPRDPDWYLRDIESHRAEAPIFGPVNRNIAPCAFWPTRPAGPPVRVHNSVPALVVAADGDISATIDLGRAMHGALTGSRMITLKDVRGHGVYLFQGAACVDDAVNAYLRTGRLPAGDLECARA